MLEKKIPLVEMIDISVSFGGIKAVDEASVDLYPGEVVALVGHNDDAGIRVTRASSATLIPRRSRWCLR